MHAYSQLKRILDERQLTVPELHRRIQRRGLRVNLKSLYRLSDDRQPVERLDLRVAGVICQVCDVPLSALIAFENPRPKLRRLPASRQKRLDALMANNNEGTLSRSERKELEGLVREAEEIALENARTLARQRHRLTSG